jgi:hypothetical protein
VLAVIVWSRGVGSVHFFKAVVRLHFLAQTVKTRPIAPKGKKTDNKTIPLNNTTKSTMEQIK